jgi:hypothetical protein
MHDMLDDAIMREATRPRPKPILCLDFDGVVHSYKSGWKGAHVIPDAPVPGALDFIYQALKSWRVSIFSSRSKSLRGRWAMKGWLYRHYVNWEWERVEAEWQRLIGCPADWTPWTHGDIDDVHRECARAVVKQIEWPWFKPAAVITIDDRALTFDGTWPALDTLKAFKPWNKR